ncbi:MAG: CocE/NonD family hydrolase, partial [Candidatus Zixiibacteriota bacterium]
TGDITGSAMSKINERDYAKLLKHLPVVELDSLILEKENKYWREWIAHPDLDDYWKRACFLDRLENLNIPVYHQSGWYDGDGIGSKLNYAAMKKSGHGNQRLVLGPWGHSEEATRRGPNNTDFGPNAIVDMQRSYLRWMDRWLLGIDNGIDKEPLVSVFVMGSNDWLYGDTYPLPETEFTKYYLASKGLANSTLGDGWLSTEAPVDSVAAYDKYVYDPADPTPDPNFRIDEDEECDSTAAEAIEVAIEKRLAYYAMIDSVRNDILVFDTPPMTDSMTFVGPIEAVLYAATSAVDTDWFMRLSKVDSNGQVFPLTHGVIRARYHKSMSKPELLVPGDIYEYHIDMWQTGLTVMPGERLRVEVASASFPMFSRNLNTGGHNEMETEFITAEQTIYHDKEHPSHIILPVIKNPAFGQK